MQIVESNPAVAVIHPKTTPRSPSQDPFATVDAPLPVEPQRIGSYRVLHPIAAGGMGMVFRALNVATGETVALKVVQRPGDLPTREKHRTFFLREMSILSRLNHPRIVAIRDFGSSDGQLFMAMEYVKTIDLCRELQRCPAAQQVRLVCGIGCYALAGLAHAHALNIVHRDIKPANLLVYRNPNQAHKIGIKLADFGVSKDVRNAGLSGMTSEGEMRGTPAFMAPEQLRNSRDAGPASDIYSTAAVLYYFLTGVIPHQKKRDVPVKLSDLVEGQPTPIASWRSDLAPRLCEIIDRAPAPIENGRYQTAVEFNQALIEFTRKGAR